MDDHDLLRDFVSTGNQSSFDELVVRYSRLVYGVCRRLLPDSDLTEDAVQATFIVLMRKAERVAGSLQGRSLAGWLHVTAQRAALQMRRSRSRRRHHEQAAALIQPSESTPVDDGEDLRCWLDGALAALSGAQREALLLRYAQGLSQEDAAGIMGCSRETVHTHVTRALTKLRAGMRRAGLTGSASAILVVLADGGSRALPQSLVTGIHSACFHPIHSSPAWIAATQVISGTTAMISTLTALAVVAVIGVGAGVHSWHHATASVLQPVSTSIAPHGSDALLTYHGHQHGVVGISFAAQGGDVASASWDNTVQTWRSTDGSIVASQTVAQSGIHALAGTLDANLLATVSSDGQAILWSRSPLARLRALAVHSGRLLCVAIAPHGACIATGALDGTVQLWSTTGTLLWQAQRPNGGIWSVAFSPDGTLLATAGDDHRASIWSVADGTHLGDFLGHTDCLRTVAVAPDGATLATGGNDGTVRLWRMADRRMLRTWSLGTLPRALAYAPDSLSVAVATGQGARLLSLSDGQQRTLGGAASLLAVAVSPDGRELACGQEDGLVTLLSLGAGGTRFPAAGH